ncbi:MAG: outer membrane beta-barrel protein [Desulfobacterium sp.]|nr:outer membrane beta-barrel protein [Desulfobacterium sp.]
MKRLLLLFILSLVMPVSMAYSAQTVFTPRFSVTEDFTDNVYLTRYNRQEDFVLTPSAMLAFAISNPTRELAISYNPAYSFYHNYSENDTFRQQAALTAGSGLGKNTRFEISDSFLQTEDPVSDFQTADPAFQEDFTRRKDRQTYYRNAARAELSHQFGPSDSFSLAYAYDTLENKDPGLEDNRRHVPSVSLIYWLTPRWGTETDLSFEKGEFEESADFNNSIGRFRLTRVFSKHFETFVQYTHTMFDDKGEEKEDYQVYDPALGFTWKMDQDTTFSVSAGYFIRDLEVSDNESGMTINGDLGKKWTFRRSAFSLTGSSGYDQSYYGAENLGFSKYYQVRGNGKYEFSRHLSADIFGSFRHTRYEDLEENRKDDLTSVGSGLNYRITQWLMARLSYVYRTLDSSNEEDAYDENRVMLMFSVAPAQPIRL